MNSVYIETTIPSFYFETRNEPYCQSLRVATRRWWDQFSNGYRIVTSPVTLDELSDDRFPARKRHNCLKLIRDVPLLAATREIDRIAKAYVDQFVMPRSTIGDAYHLAFASLPPLCPS